MDFLLKEKYNPNYLKFLDNNINFKSLTDDSIFKSIIFKNIDIFKRFLVEFLKIEKNYEEVSIILIDKELIKDKINEHGKVVDFNIIIDNNIILDIELKKVYIQL